MVPISSVRRKSAVQETSCLREMLPVGVVVGASLASLRKYLDVSVASNNSQMEGVDFDFTQQTMQHAYKLGAEKMKQKEDLDIGMQESGIKTETKQKYGRKM